MTIAVQVEVAELPIGARAREGDPLGFFFGNTNVTGDASGGQVVLGWTVDTGHDISRVYVPDSVSLITDSAVDPGNVRVDIQHRHELSNIALDAERRTVVDSLSSGANFTAQLHQLTEWLRAFPIYYRQDFGDLQIVRMTAENNNNGQLYQFRIWGRTYDVRILGSRDVFQLLPGFPPSR